MPMVLPKTALPHIWNWVQRPKISSTCRKNAKLLKQNNIRKIIQENA